MFSYFNAPLFPSSADPMLWVAVIGCFGFWLAAYVGMIAKGFRDQIFCVPVAACCGNILWEFVFAFVYPNDYLLVRLGNCAWLGFDVAILATVLLYRRNDFKGRPELQRFIPAFMLGGTLLGCFVLLRFTEVYNDTLGYSSGWMQAFLMAFLFIAMLMRREGVRGQSMLIAIGMVFGNCFAWLWVRDFPAEPRLDPAMNNTYAIAVVSLNAAYAVLLFNRYRKLGINPWSKQELLGGGESNRV